MQMRLHPYSATILALAGAILMLADKGEGGFQVFDALLDVKPLVELESLLPFGFGLVGEL